MKQGHAFLTVLVSVVGWILSPLVFLLWNLGAILPGEFLRRCAGPFGRFIRRRSKEKTLKNMREVLNNPEWTKGHWDDLWRSHARHVGLTIVELLQLESRPPEELSRRLIVEGEEHLQSALDRG